MFPLRTVRLLLIGLVAFAALMQGRPTTASERQPQTSPLHAELGQRAALLNIALKPWTGDLDGMAKRGLIRALVVYDGLFYFLDGFQEKGVTFEEMTLFESALNRDLKLKHGHKVQVVFIPVERDRLIPDLLEGIGDIAASNITVTPERQAKVDFTTPFSSQVSELLVSGKAFPKIATPEDLSGQQVAVRPDSSFHDTLTALNKTLAAAGKPPVDILAADEHLTDGALAQMVAEGLYPATLLDSYEVGLWRQVYPELVVHETVPLSVKGEIAWAIRKGSPQLKAKLDKFVGAHRVGTKITNILVNRYLKNPRYIREAIKRKEDQPLAATIDLFKTYADRYQFHWLLLVAQGYQESKLNQKLRSAAGAVGLMQLLPSTAAAPPIEINDIAKPGPNVEAGAKYMRYIIDTYFDDPGLSQRERHLMALAAYNAGPTRIAHLRTLAPKHHLDPNRWFGSMEILVGQAVGRQPVDYVRNIFEYYIAYQRSEEIKKAETLAGKVKD
ncbi:MAG: lytic transglycosylase F [Rhodospirillales bacterium]